MRRVLAAVLLLLAAGSDQSQQVAECQVISGPERPAETHSLFSLAQYPLQTFAEGTYKLGRHQDEAAFQRLGALEARGPQRERIEALLGGEVATLGQNPSVGRLLEAAGYQQTTYNVTSADGYVTQPTRIKKPSSNFKAGGSPVVIYGGQAVAPSLFVQDSLAVYSEEKPEQQHNRSLAMALCDAGLDVWVVPARGVDAANRGWLNMNRKMGWLDRDDSLNGRPKWLNGPYASLNYWNFSNDEIIEHEFGRQLELVMEVSGARRVSLVLYSNGALIALGFLSTRPQWQDKLDVVVALAPAIYVNPTNWIVRVAGLYSAMGPLADALYPDALDKIWRHQWLQLCKARSLRYTACRLLLDSIYGPSTTTFHAYLGLGLLESLARPIGVRSARQLVQAADTGRLAKLDLGPLENLLHYGQPLAPAYDLSQVKLPHLYLFSASNDALAYPLGIQRLLGQLGRKPLRHFKLDNYNGLDLVAGWDVDKRVVEPVKDILLQRAIEASREDVE